MTLKNLSKVYQTAYIETAALKKINLRISKGEFVAMMGPSGCEKSTRLTVIRMTDRPIPG
ncbi:MAG TPA: hypothetical protein DCL66_05695 [Gammaproteobacteria bacterium]|nr:hypothetical protein [Gammaproteobacteria bacterium]